LIKKGSLNRHTVRYGLEWKLPSDLGFLQHSCPYDNLVENMKRECQKKIGVLTVSEESGQVVALTEDYDAMDGHDFERFSAELLMKNGYINVKATVGSGDFGADVLAERDGIKYAIQCKREKENIGNKAVQEALSGKVHYKAHIGAVMTNQYFTTSAKKQAESSGIILWDRAHIEKLIES